ncbi:phenylalanine--tRNA ligase subunit beta [Blattabacterium cuenoti]|uniref:phenylalanine--tRNA ligase subunit beta n=1 Tax=Blattabacterium cuenoti TaxID=1653831 RepID=UPI00163CD6A8|nr:phenylalanine--tRNA ligase subunit beta [Blattabacterium cuenoti]
MKISFNWIKEYISFTNINIDENQISEILTDIGMNVKNTYVNSNTKDFIFEIEIIPNRNDIISHYGIAKDLYAALIFRGYNVFLKKLNINKPKKYSENKISIILKDDHKRCIRYSGMSIFQIKIDTSPSWLISKLNSLGIKSVNNIVDIINFVIYELGIPFHLFNLDKIDGKKIFIKNLDRKNKFLSIPNNINKLYNNDLIIYDNKNILSLSGIINNNKYEIINQDIKNIFIGCISLNSTYVKIFKKKYSISSSDHPLFLLEKGIDPNKIIFALHRLYYLIKNFLNKNITVSKIIDIYPYPINQLTLKLNYNNITNIIGEKIQEKNIKKILLLLDIHIIKEYKNYILVSIPTSRTDIKREIDLIEEILRIYGINNIKINDKINIVLAPKIYYQEEYKIQQLISEQLINYGFQEIISSTIRNYNKKELLINSFFKREKISIINSDNNKIMRNNLLFGIIDCINYNYNHNRINIKDNIKIFEIGKIYYKKNGFFLEKTYLGISISKINIKNNQSNILYFLYFKGIIEQILQKMGINNYIQYICDNPLLENNISFLYKKKELVSLGKVKKNYSKNHKIFYAQLNWNYLIHIIQKNKFIYHPLSKYPISRRDLSFLINKNITFEELNQSINNQKNNLIKEYRIYDIYEDKIFLEKKSYTVSFFFESSNKTLKNEIINHSMNLIENFLEKKFNAIIRKNVNY